MRSSRATCFLVVAIAAATCIQTGCRLGKTASNMSFSRPRLLARKDKDKDKPDTTIASTKPKPPASSIPPAGTSIAANGANSRSFPSEPAPTSYASTSDQYGGSGDYASTGDSYGSTDRGSGSRNNSDYASTNGPSNPYVATSGGGSERGFYDTEYPGGNGGSSYESTAGGGSPTRSGGYDSYAGGQADYGQPYADSASRDQGYQQVADRRGDSWGNSGSDSSYSGGSDYNAPSSYGNDPQYGATADSRSVSPGGNSNYDDYRSPAQGSYNDSYNSGNNYNGGATAGTSTGYNDSYNSGNNYGNTNAAANSSTGTAPASWRPGSTGSAPPFGQKPLSPPTNNGWGN